MSEDEDAHEAKRGAQRHEKRGIARKLSGQLWGTELFPSGISISAVADMKNLEKALAWQCSCSKLSVSCLDVSRVNVCELYAHRTAFQLRACTGGGKRDTLRKDLESHYDEEKCAFQHTFKIGKLASHCAPAFGVACGVAFETFKRARTDVTRKRPLRAGRLAKKLHALDEGATQVRQYLVFMCTKMEGSKGGTFVNGQTKYYTAAKTAGRRYDDYVVHCNTHGVQVKCCTLRAFTAEWARNTSIVEVHPTGHAKCDTCSELDAREATILGRNDADALRIRAEIDEDRREHNRIADAPRAVFDRATFVAEHRPDLVTMLNIDAPTRHQFDLPRMPAYRDVPKHLENSKRWESKVTGVMDAGLGMRVFVVHESIGGGANLVCTVMYLALLAHAQVRPLGKSLHVQLDNTCGENKCITVIAFVCWLVTEFSFEEAIINCMPVGHTFTILDASFNTMIAAMKKREIVTGSQMRQEIFRRMQAHTCLEVRELTGVFDFTSWLQPICAKLTGYARREALGVHYSGMGQFHFSREIEGATLLRMRVSPLSTTWLPDGPGYTVFTSGVEGQPPYKALKPFDVWRKDTVVSSIRKWLPYLGIDVEAQSECMREWEERLNSLTPSISEVKDLPVWCGPPKCQRRAVHQTTTDGVRRPWLGTVENPPVNPITTNANGPEKRTDTMLERELKAWQAANRTQASVDGASPPIHLGDYLIIHRSDCGPQPALIRVLGGDLGTSGEDVNVSGTLYAYTPNPELLTIWGWGTFCPLKNESYDRNDRSKGRAHTTREQVRRSDVKVYYTRTFLDHDAALRIHVDSLRELATFRQYAETAITIPTSHISDGNRAVPARLPRMQPAPINDTDAPVFGNVFDDGPGEEQYEVDSLLDRKRSKGKKHSENVLQMPDGARKNVMVYLVKWVGAYPDTWEKASNIHARLIKAYEDAHGPFVTEDEQVSEEEMADVEKPMVRRKSSRTEMNDRHAELFGSDDSGMSHSGDDD